MVLRFCGVAASQLWTSTLLCFFCLVAGWLRDMDHIPDKTSLSLRSGICTWQTSRRGRWAIRNAGLAAREDGRTSRCSRWRERTCGRGDGRARAYVWASRATLFLFLYIPGNCKATNMENRDQISYFLTPCQIMHFWRDGARQGW